MTDSLVPRQDPTASSDPLTVLDDVPLSEDEERYAGAAPGRALDIGPAPDQPPLQLATAWGKVLVPPGHERVGLRKRGGGGAVEARPSTTTSVTLSTLEADAVALGRPASPSSATRGELTRQTW